MGPTEPSLAASGCSFFLPLLPLGEGRLESGARGAWRMPHPAYLLQCDLSAQGSHIHVPQTCVWSLALGGLWMLTQLHRKYQPGAQRITSAPRPTAYLQAKRGARNGLGDLCLNTMGSSRVWKQLVKMLTAAHATHWDPWVPTTSCLLSKWPFSQKGPLCPREPVSD